MLKWLFLPPPHKRIDLLMLEDNLHGEKKSKNECLEEIKTIVDVSQQDINDASITFFLYKGSHFGELNMKALKKFFI